MNVEMLNRVLSLPAKHDKRLERSSRLLCLQELLAYLPIGLQALLMGKNDLFLAFYSAVKAICAVQRLQKAIFCL